MTLRLVNTPAFAALEQPGFALHLAAAQRWARCRLQPDCDLSVIADWLSGAAQVAGDPDVRAELTFLSDYFLEYRDHTRTLTSSIYYFEARHGG